MEGTVPPDDDPPQEMGDPDKEVCHIHLSNVQVYTRRVAYGSGWCLLATTYKLVQ